MNALTGVKRRLMLLSLIAGMACASQFAFRPPAARAGELAITYAEECSKTISVLETLTSAFKLNRTTPDSLRTALLRTRYAYKKVEFLLAYYYPEFVDEHINGAPLLRMERNYTRAAVRGPEGLQVLDELIFSKQPDKEKVKIAAVALQLKANFKILLAGFRERTVNMQEWAAAMRIQLVRILSLGITGFDTPGSLNALQEATSCLTSMRHITASGIRPDEHQQLFALLDSALSYLERPVSFDDFDRLLFVKKYLHPLYKAYLPLQGNMPLIRNAGWNSRSEDIFADSFLDPYYYTELTREEDSRELQQLGKRLFYDPLLSGNNKMSCASCHQPSKAFADGQPTSESNVQGIHVARNAPTLLNAIYADRYFYDLRAFSLEQQAEHVIFNQMEFNTAYGDIVRKLEGNSQYQQLFKACFGKGNISRDGFSKALASYVLSLRSFNSPFDRYIRGEAETIPADVQHGFNLFMGKAACGTCHFAPVFSGLVPPLYTENESEVLGVPAAGQKTIDPDRGRGSNQLYSEMAWIHEHAFKTTSVRNAGLTAPYFHNGIYKTLEEVNDFYDNGGGTGLGFTMKYQTLSGDSLHLSATEKKDLIAFINALSDTTHQMQ